LIKCAICNVLATNRALILAQICSMIMHVGRQGAPLTLASNI